MFIGKIGKQWQGQNCLPEIYQKRKRPIRIYFLNIDYRSMLSHSKDLKTHIGENSPKWRVSMLVAVC